MGNKISRVKAFCALVILVPAPSLGVLFGMFLFPDSALGKSLFLFTKIWVFILPAIWLKFIDGNLRKPCILRCALLENAHLFLYKLRFSRFGDALPTGFAEVAYKGKFSVACKGGIAAGIFSGVIIMSVIVGGFFIAGDKLVDKNFFVEKLTSVGLTNTWLYFGTMIYWILINSRLSPTLCVGERNKQKR